jgi:hypothetical protein
VVADAPPGPGADPGRAQGDLIMPRLVYLLGVGIGLVAIAFALTYQLLTPPPGVTLENVRRVQPGMSRDQVERLLGGPGKQAVILRYGPVCPHELTWVGRDCVLFVTFDDHWRVEVAAPIDARPPGGPTPYPRLLPR